ncbi:ApbE family protein [uncultured archaeon]|nr:ApbE family protein [uncultured archaeon]
MELQTQSRELLGSVFEIKLPARHSPLFSSCFSEIARIERAYSRFLPDSELTRLNSNLGPWQDAGPEMLSLVQQAEQFHKLTGGHFDITLKSALEEMGYGPKIKKERKQNSGHFLSFLNLSSSRPQINMQKGQIRLSQPIEFGGLGKGYALDRLASLLEAAGVGHYYLNGGGDIYAKRAPGEEPWPVLLEHPDDPERAIGKVELDGQAIAGSAPNRRKWGAKGEMHHLLNAKTKKPAQGVKAIFVLAQTGIEADAYSTAIFTAGFEEGIEMSWKLPVKILMVSSEGKMYQTPGFGAELFD